MRQTRTARQSSTSTRSPLNGELRIGISGWNYKGWRGIFYPPKHPHERELEFASRAFNTIAINGTFYSLQRPVAFSEMVCHGAGRFPFCGEGCALHHAYEEAARGTDSAGQLLRLRPPLPRRKTWANPLAVSP